MTRTLLRPCLDCGKAVRGKPRCADCRAIHHRAMRVLCRAENGRRSGAVRRGILTILGAPDPSPAEQPITDAAGPVVA